MSELRKASVAIAAAMLADGAIRHVSYIGPDDLPKEFEKAFVPGRVLKVTTEWVEVAETEPDLKGAGAPSAKWVQP